MRAPSPTFVVAIPLSTRRRRPSNEKLRGGGSADCPVSASPRSLGLATLAGGRRGRRLALQTFEERADVGLKGLALVRGNGRARDVLLVEGVHESTVLHDA